MVQQIIITLNVVFFTRMRNSITDQLCIIVINKQYSVLLFLKHPVVYISIVTIYTGCKNVDKYYEILYLCYAERQCGVIYIAQK